MTKLRTLSRRREGKAH